MATGVKVSKGGKTKAVKKHPWVSYSNCQYRKAIEGLVHYSAKAVNGNAPAFGVRVSQVDKDIPYIAASTVSGVFLDYIIMTGIYTDADEILIANTKAANEQADRLYKEALKEAKKSGSDPSLIVKPQPQAIAAVAAHTAHIMRQVNAVQAGNVDDVFDNPSMTDVGIIEGYLAGAASGHVGDGDEVYCRIKQVLMPDENGNDVSLSPLHSPGLSRMINMVEASLVSEHNESLAKKEDAIRKAFDRAHMGYGGANPQNIGSMVFDMSRPVFFYPPTEDRWIRQAMATYYKGVEIAPSSHLMREYMEFISKLRPHGGQRAIRRNADLIKKEEGHIRAITRALILRGDKARDLLVRHAVSLPIVLDKDGNVAGPLVSSAIDPVAAGLIDKSLRGKGWRSDFSLRLATAIADFKWTDPATGDVISTGFDGADVGGFRQIIEMEII